MKPENFVRMTGFLVYPKLTQTSTGKHKFDGKIAIPLTYKNKQTGEDTTTRIMYKISAWGDTAEALGELAAETPITVQGRFNERSYDGKCEHCGGITKKYWSDVQVDTFTIALD